MDDEQSIINLAKGALTNVFKNQHFYEDFIKMTKTLKELTQSNNWRQRELALRDLTVYSLLMCLRFKI